MNRNKKSTTQGKDPNKIQPLQSRLNLKPNEAYEPGIGKYTLTESELRAKEINQQEAEGFSKTAGRHPASAAGTEETKSSRKSGSSTSETSHNGPGVNHYPGASDSKQEQEEKMREENTRKHNNW